MKRFDAKSITRHEERVIVLIPNRKGEHAAQTFDDIHAPLFVTVQNGFGVRSRSKFVTGVDEFTSQIRIVVNLAVENDPK